MDDASAARLLVLLAEYTKEYMGSESDNWTVRELVDDLVETIPLKDYVKYGPRGGMLPGSILKEEIEQAVFICRIWR